MRIWSWSVGVALLGSALVSAQMVPDRSGGVGPEAQRAVEINNRILACPNDKPISVMDLTRKLNVMFMQEYPQYANSPETRFQFFQMAWRQTLDEMINNELILADAEEKELTISDGEVHRELEEMFGPDVVTTLDELGLHYDEAWEMVQTDLLVSRMRGSMVMYRAFCSVNPSMIAEAYEQFVEESLGQDKWVYRVLSIRHPDREVAETLAQTAQELLLASEVVDLDAVASLLEEQKDGRAIIKVTASQERTLDSLASSHRDALEPLVAGEISAPVGQVSRVDRCMVCRIFHLVDFIEELPPSFKEMEPQLQNRLLYAAMQVEKQKYIVRLRHEYGVTDDYLAVMIPSDFQPYALR